MEYNYYTPDIEDVRIGYELEVYQQTYYRDEKDKVIMRKEWLETKVSKFNIPLYTSTINSIRVPFLTKEQIEAEGWAITQRELKPSPYQVDWINAKKDEYDLWINLAMHKSMHLGVDKHKWGILYRGQCKSINEFRTIMKLLKIK